MIAARGLTRRYGDFVAVNDIRFEIPQGSICAFLGPNGAGKSTTVKMLTGLLEPTSGDAEVAGIRVSTRSLDLRRAIGVLPENLGLFDALTVEEHLRMAGRIYSLSRHDTNERARQLLRALDLEHGSDRFLDHCSHGMRKKTALALALIHNPRVLFLDEPFEGIDPVTSKTIRDLLITIAGRGTTVFLTSHILSIVGKLASHVIMIRQGNIVWHSTADALPQELEQHYFDLVEAPKSEELPWLGSRQS
ncbi:MAG: ABC transporter ATP-binding protein [Bryobacterales bacterium]|nr:ABC transporter ATP-binding protein [Bryobacterales bacterium]